MHLLRNIRLVAIIACASLAACRPSFVPAKFTSNEALFAASRRQIEAKRWDNAIAGFERLTTELPARDTLFPPSLWYLGKAHQGRGEWLLAAQSFQRLAETFPSDTLADDAYLEAGLSYSRLWRKPQLDPQYGEQALATLHGMLSVYPSSPLVPRAQKEIAHLNDWLARKDYETGLYYYRRKGYESSILYFRNVVDRYAGTPTAREAMLKLAEAYRRINYREELAETCGALRQSYPGEGRVGEVCDGVPATAARDSVKTTDTATTPETTIAP